MARYDDIDTKFVFFATIVSCLLLVASLQGFQALCYYMSNWEEARKLGASEYVDSSKIISEQKESLLGYNKASVPPATGADGKPVSDKPTSLIRIPIEEAQKQFLKEAASKKPTAPKT
jgi:hypothetical protein